MKTSPTDRNGSGLSRRQIMAGLAASGVGVATASVWEAEPAAAAGSGLTPTPVKTTSYTAAVNDFVPVDASARSARITITLPASPADGSEIGVKTVALDPTSRVTVSSAGSDSFNLSGGPTSIDLSSVNQGVLAQYSAASKIWYVEADTATAAIAPPPSNVGLSSLGTQFQYVAQKNGNDANDGLSWGKPKLSLDAAVAALPLGGVIFIAPGSYAPSDTLYLNGHHLFGMVDAPGLVNGTVTINYGFHGSAAGHPLLWITHGAQLSNIGLAVISGTASPGDAIYCVSPAYTYPTAAIATGTVTSITGASPVSGYSSSGYIGVDDEVFAYSALNSGTFTITSRAVGGTSAASHTTSSPIWQATVLSSPLGAGDTMAQVAATDGWLPTGVIYIDGEVMAYTGVTATSFTGLQRGILGTAAAAHANGAACRQQYAARPGGIYIDTLYVGGGFASDMHLDGSNNNYPGGPGIRQVQVSKAYFFGSTSGNSIHLNRVVHACFNGVEVITAGGNSSQSIVIDDSITEQIFFSNTFVEGGSSGGFTSAAAGSSGDSVGTVVFEGYIDGSVTFAQGSKGNRVIGPILKGVTNNGSADNVTDQPPWNAATLTGGWSSFGAGYAAAGYSIDAGGTVRLRGRIGSGTAAVGTQLFVLASGYRPSDTCNLLAWGETGTGAFRPCLITINTSGSVLLGTSLAGSGGKQSISFDGLQFSTT